MKLSKIALLALRGTGKEFKDRLAEKCDVTRRTLDRWIADNDDSLTKAEPLQLIREETGLKDDQILQQDAEPELVSK
jgi:hypothetical protein